ncbi:uncharacterized protein LOC123313645 [Coccinella septempunctata]|uniref:uncharacterized protein LOC123313645 n=1 Tax=Coccinella septempunctata TaxID=41139 RepID=UPI001D08427F|nr:uncharacterized protein LOC123313645 [Coccinella septempunctata]
MNQGVFKRISGLFSFSSASKTAIIQLHLFVSMWWLSVKEWRLSFICPLVLVILFGCTIAYPSPGEDYVLTEKEYSSPGAHQLASWLTAQRRPKEITVIKDLPVIPYRLPLQGKRNSEVTNAIIRSEETQRMYREGRK